MPALAECVALEWGRPFLIGAGAVLLLLALVVVWLVRSLRGQVQITIENWKITEWKITLAGVEVPVLLALLVIGVVGYYAFTVTQKKVNAYAVALDVPYAGITLETAREKFQGDTNVKIRIEKRAQSFLIRGRYQAVCPADMFEMVCRQYSSDLQCTPSIADQMLSIDLHK